jgi:hypothetical protein
MNHRFSQRRTNVPLDGFCFEEMKSFQTLCAMKDAAASVDTVGIWHLKVEPRSMHRLLAVNPYRFHASLHSRGTNARVSLHSSADSATVARTSA